MKTILLVLDALGIGEMPDVKELRKSDIGANTLESIHKVHSLDDTYIAEFNLSPNIKNSVDHFKLGEIQTKKCALSYKGADSNLGHQNITGIFPKDTKEFISDIYIKLEEVLSQTHKTFYLKEKEVLIVDNYIFISNNMECDPGLNINVLGALNSIPFKKILEVGRVVRETISCSRVIIMGGKPLDNEKIINSIQESVDNETGTRFKGINIPLTNIYNKDYEVVHLSYEGNDKNNMLNNLSNKNIPISLIGKTANLFPGLRATYIPSIDTKSVMKNSISQSNKQTNGLIFINIQELDLAGHSQDVHKAFKVLTTFNEYFAELVETCRDEDLIIITADHGNDPLNGTSLHTREYVPFVLMSKKNEIIGKDISLPDIGFSISKLYTNKGTAAGKMIIKGVNL